MFNNVFTGSVEGTGATINVELGFKPKYIKVFNYDDAGSLYPTVEWWDGMTAAYGLKNIRQAVDEGGTATYSVVNELITSGGLSQYSGSPPPVALTGTCAVSVGSAVVTGTSTAFTSELSEGDLVGIGGITRKVLSIASATSLTVTEDYSAAQSGVTGYDITGKELGFTISTDSDLNVSGETIFYLAVR